MSLASELQAHQQLDEVKHLLQRGILTPREAIAVCSKLEHPDAPLAAHDRACFVDYLEGLSDVWIQPDQPE